MPEYQEQPVTGRQWTRVRRVVIENPRGESPSLSAYEETAIQLGDELILRPQGMTLAAVFDPAGEFPLRHPLTDEDLGRSATQQELQVLVYSFCRELQRQRDEIASATAPEETLAPVG